jgi:type II secretory pathway pseudopilin PulG
MPQSINRRIVSRRAFTLSEMVVAIGTISILGSLLLPAVQKVRDYANRATAENVTREICHDLHLYLENHAKYPESLGALIDEVAKRDDPSYYTEYEELIDGRIFGDGYVFELAFDQATIKKRLEELRSLGPDGQELAEQIVAQASPREFPEFLIFARPVVPGKTGCVLIYVDPDCSPSGIVDPNCKAIQLEMFQRLNQEAIEASSTLLASDADVASSVIATLREDGTKKFVFNLVDVDGDGKATVLELRRFSRLQRLSTAENQEPDPLTVLQDYVQFAFDEMQFGAGGENLEELGVTLEEIPGDMTAVFHDSDNYRPLIEELVDDEGVANSLAVKLRAAEQAHQRWEAADPETRDDEAEACAAIVGAFRNELWAQEGKSIDFNDALLLDAAVSFFCPAVEQSLD